MNKTVYRFAKKCLVLVLFSSLYIAWYLSGNTCNRFDVTGKGHFELSVSNNVAALFIPCGGSATKKLLWEKPDGTEITYVFNETEGDFCRPTIYLLGNQQGLLIDDGDGKILLAFDDEVLYGSNPGRKYVNGRETAMYMLQPLPADYASVGKTLLSRSSPPSDFESLLFLAFTLLWFPILLLNVICLGILFVRILQLAVIRGAKEQEQ